jgi:DNA invertase Pin-like site-specific DNA recombinase
MTMVAYARTSSTDQTGSLETQVARFKELGVDPDLIFSEQRSGSSADRPKLKECLRTLRKGDTLLVTKIDRLARSMADLLVIMQGLEKKGVGFKALDQPEIDTTKSTGRLLLGILASVAEFERSLIRERQAEGIKRALERGQRFGPEPKADAQVIATIKAMRAEGKLIRGTRASSSALQRSSMKGLRSVSSQSWCPTPWANSNLLACNFLCFGCQTASEAIAHQSAASTPLAPSACVRQNSASKSTFCRPAKCQALRWVAIQSAQRWARS